MHKFTENQLQKCTTFLPDWDSSTKELVINHITSKTVDTTLNKLNIIIENYIINEPANFTLSANWNGGTVPPEQQMVVEIIEQRGKMYKVKGKGITSNIIWEGWLPGKGFNVI